MPILSWANVRPPLTEAVPHLRARLTAPSLLPVATWEYDTDGPVVEAGGAIHQRIWATFRNGGAHSRWIAVWSAVSVIGTIATPLLLNRPLLLLALAPRTVAVALAANHLSMVELIIIGTIRLSLADPSYFLLGRRFAATPSRVPARCGPLRRLIAWLFSLIERSPLLAAAVIFVRPSGRYLAVAGAKGVSATLTATAAVAGTVTYLALAHIGIDRLW